MEFFEVSREHEADNLARLLLNLTRQTTVSSPMVPQWWLILLAVVLSWFTPAHAFAHTRAGQAAYDAGASLEKVVYVAGITMDTDEGHNQDPLSLHKYLYCEANPANHIDPSGHDLGDLVLTMSIQASMFAMRIAPVINAARLAIATVAIVGFAADPEVRDIYMASAGSPGAATQMLAADIRFVSTAGIGLFRAGAAAPNIVNIRFNGGDAGDFRVKTENLKRAADGLILAGYPCLVRPVTEIQGRASYGPALGW